MMVKSMILKMAGKFFMSRPALSMRISNFTRGRTLLNLNLNAVDKCQKRALLSYLDVGNIKLDNIGHANFYQAVQMTHALIKSDFCIDVCYCNDPLAFEFIKNEKYDVIIGLGDVYKKACEHCSKEDTVKILFVTENFPLVVEKKFAERIEYFKSRHPKISFKSSSVRSGYYDEEIFKMSNYAIAMTSSFNIEPMKAYVRKTYQINANVLKNTAYKFVKSERLPSIKSSRNRFLWFGSLGLIHKGVDILLDAFKELPDLSLEFYGLYANEKKLFNKLKPVNANDCGCVNVQKDEFIDKVVKRHCFMLLASCSEGMSTAVATCMLHGIIPVVTKESGFEPCDCIIELPDFKVETVKNAVLKLCEMSDEEVLNLSEKTYNYAMANFSLEHFDVSFNSTLKEILAYSSL